MVFSGYVHEYTGYMATDDVDRTGETQGQLFVQLRPIPPQRSAHVSVVSGLDELEKNADDAGNKNRNGSEEQDDVFFEYVL